MERDPAERRLYTVGHSNRPLEDFLSLLRGRRVRMLADVRTIPKSRHVPHFNKDSFSKALREARIEYLHFPGLGGLRSPKAASVNSGWKNSSFRGFADYMQTSDFRGAIEELLALIDRSTVALMCAEAVPWRCHRSLISDALLIRGISVEHILSPSRIQPHRLTPFARVSGTEIIYPGLLQGEAF
jgi:uncharacterized protein (DUF488 family)